MNENKEYITHTADKGTINISEEVVAAIAASAVLEVEGVASLPSNIGKDLAELFGKKNIARGVIVTKEEGDVVADVFIIAKSGFAVNAVAEAVQDKAASAIESMTGFGCRCVNVHVCGVAIDR